MYGWVVNAGYSHGPRANDHHVHHVSASVVSREFNESMSIQRAMRQDNQTCFPRTI